MPLSSVAVSLSAYGLICFFMYRLLLYLFPDVAAVMLSRRGDCDAFPAGGGRVYYLRMEKHLEYVCRGRYRS